MFASTCMFFLAPLFISKHQCTLLRHRWLLHLISQSCRHCLQETIFAILNNSCWKRRSYLLNFKVAVASLSCLHISSRISLLLYRSIISLLTYCLYIVKAEADTHCLDRYTRAHQEMRYLNLTWRIILYDYLFTTERRHTCTYFSR